ncbi:MAG: radical SAM protein [Rhodospirillales bacterium 20-60-12]|nr:MAG: radical SAM protein [Rhodospirillales bacterium 20-60-12]HQT68626.1 PA0069 family radical SAM protein [Acetobacteraceae bacterium]
MNAINMNVIKGRGTALNPPDRFAASVREAFDDGWGEQESAAPPPTVLIRDQSRSIMAWNDSPDLDFDRSINSYRGCEHGCIYCFARPSHSYLGFSPGLDFETKIVFKPDSAALLTRELCKRGYKPQPIVVGANTDPYQPVERRLALTRSVLEVLERFSHPVSIVTKSAGVLRDIDILARMATRNLVRVFISITTLDPVLARSMEPRAASPARRLAAIAALAAQNIPVGVFASPMIPGLNDAELEHILKAAAEAGAGSANAILLRLPYELKSLFTDWLEQHVPHRAQHVLSLIRQTRQGELNQSGFHDRFVGSGPYADVLAARFAQALKRTGLTREPAALDCSQFALPAELAPAKSRQLSLL